MDTLPPEVRAFFQANGRKRGQALYEKHGPQYFRDLAAKRKNPGRKKKVVENQENEQS